MTNEEAIALLEDQMNFNRTMQRGWGNSMIETDAGKIVDGTLYANQHKDVADALELAINALRAGGTDTNVPTMPAGQPMTLEQLRGMANKAFAGGKRGRPKKRTNEERLKQMGTQELARELSLIAMWDRKQLKKAQENPGLEAFMGKWLREPAEDN